MKGYFKDSNWILLCAIIVLFSTTSCSLFKKSQGNNGGQNGKVIGPPSAVITEKEKITKPVEEEKIDIIKPDRDPIITQGNEFEDYNKQSQTYNMAVLLPFNAHLSLFNDSTANPEHKKTRMALDLYKGMSLAFDDLAKEGVNLNVEVIDTENNEFKLKNVISSGKLMNKDLVLGPVLNNNVKTMANYAYRNTIYQVSPLSPAEDMVRSNPYFIQVNPSIQTHFENMYDYIANTMNKSRIIVISSENNREVALAQKFELVKNEVPTMENRYVDIVKVIWDKENPDLIYEYLDRGQQNVVVVCTYNHKFAADVMSTLHMKKYHYPTTLFGMPNWYGFSLNLEQLNDLNFHISNSFYTPKSNSKHDAFINKFYRKTGSLPTNNACKGYDMMMYFGRMLKNYGKEFALNFNQAEAMGIYSNFKFSGVMNEGMGSQLFIDQYENKKVHILNYKNFEFLKVK